MNGSKFLQTSHGLETEHGTFSSSKRLVGILTSIVQPATCFLFIGNADGLHRRTVRPQLVRHNYMWLPVPFHRFPEEFQCRILITAVGHERFQNFTFVIYRPPKIVSFSIDLHKHFVHVPLPIGIGSELLDTPLADFGGKYRTKTVPPEPNRFMADFDASFVQQIFNIPKRKWKADIHHYRKANDLRRCF